MTMQWIDERPSCLPGVSPDARAWYGAGTVPVNMRPPWLRDFGGSGGVVGGMSGVPSVAQLESAPHDAKRDRSGALGQPYANEMWEYRAYTADGYLYYADLGARPPMSHQAGIVLLQQMYEYFQTVSVEAAAQAAASGTYTSFSPITRVCGVYKTYYGSGSRYCYGATGLKVETTSPTWNGTQGCRPGYAISSNGFCRPPTAYCPPGTVWDSVNQSCQPLPPPLLPKTTPLLYRPALTTIAPVPAPITNPLFTTPVSFTPQPKPFVRFMWVSEPGGKLGQADLHDTLTYKACYNGCAQKCTEQNQNNPSAFDACVAACESTCLMKAALEGGTPTNVGALQSKINAALSAQGICPINADGTLGPSTCDAAIYVSSYIDPSVAVPQQCANFDQSKSTFSPNCKTGGGPVAPPPCANDHPDCGAAGFICVNGDCVPGCRNDGDCGPGYRCVKAKPTDDIGQCQSAPKPTVSKASAAGAGWGLALLGLAAVAAIFMGRPGMGAGTPRRELGENPRRRRRARMRRKVLCRGLYSTRALAEAARVERKNVSGSRVRRVEGGWTVCINRPQLRI